MSRFTFEGIATIRCHRAGREIFLGQSGLRLIPISVRIAPPIFADDISESDTADGSEPSHRVANQQQGIGMDAGRQSERGLRFLRKISSKGPSMSHHDNNSGSTTTNRSGSLNIIQHVRPLGRSGWYNYYGCASIEDVAEQFPGLTSRVRARQTLIIWSTFCP